MTCPDFDPTQLQDYATVMPLGTLIELAASFRGSVLELISGLTHSGLEPDRKRLAEGAHDLKGVSGSFGAVRLQKLAEDLERCCREDRLEGVAQILAEMPEAGSRALSCLQSALDELGCR